MTPISVDGGPTGPYDDEPTLDVEQAAALAPGANFEVYQGPNNSTVRSTPTPDRRRRHGDHHLDIVGHLRSRPQGDPSAEQPIFEQMAAQGQTVVSAAGDEGSSDCNGITNNNLAVDDPASQPYVTGVGRLTVNDINPLDQTVWNTVREPRCRRRRRVHALVAPVVAERPRASARATRCAWCPTSRRRPIPAPGSSSTSPGRPPVCVHECNNGWDAIGGTSIGAPMVAALVAVAAQACGVPRLGFVNPSLYAMASTGFVDVTTGSNDLYNVGGYSAGPGYDMASGLGSPDGAAFFAGLCPPKFDLTKSSFTTSKSSALVDGAPISVTATLHDTNNVALTNALVNVTAASTGSGPSDGSRSTVTAPVRPRVVTPRTPSRATATAWRSSPSQRPNRVRSSSS